jgi:hypothetical protein
VLHDCGELLAISGAHESGAYTLAPRGSNDVARVHCDMTSDGGGWTLVAAANAPLIDASGAFHGDLATATAGAVRTIWGGLRGEVPPRHDVRFTCTGEAGAARTSVDLSFYGVPWYLEVTAGPTDAETCINENGGAGFERPEPKRRNNVTGQTLARGNRYGNRVLESEDQCGDVDDFTVDFDDAGLDGDEEDGTDWGLDDALAKCGVIVERGTWFLWVRDAQPSCANRTRDDDETGVDCGGSCPACR